MTLAYTFALLSTLLGTALGLLGGHGRISGPLRSFAFVAAIAVVFGQLLPEALSEAGVAAIGVFAAGVLVPRLLFHHHHGPGHGHGLTHGPDLFDDDGAHIRAGLWLSLVAMMLHQIGDGVALGAFASGTHAEHTHLDVFFAIAAHTVPVVGLLVHAFVQQWGRTTAFFQGLALGVSGLVGVALADAINASAAVGWTPYITAFAAGLLIHVVSHDRPPTGERDRVARVLDVVAVLAGVALVFEGGHAHGEHGGEVHTDLAAGVSDALLDLSLATAPALLLGLLLGATLQSLGRGIPRASLSGGGPLRQALRGALAGGPLPVCSCAVLPVAHAIRSRGGSAAFVIAFLLATPELGVESLLLTGRFLGWELALARLVGALLVAAGAAYVAGRVLAAREGQRPTPEADFELGGPSARWERGVAQLDELFVHILPFTMVGLLAAAYAQTALDGSALRALTHGSLDILVVTIISMPVYVCAASATPLAAVLIAKGLSPGAALVGLLLGPATNLATLGFMRASFGGRATAAAVVSAVGLTWALAYGVNTLGLHHVPPLSLGEAHAHGAVAYGCLAVLVVWTLRTVYAHGVNALFDGLKVSRFDAAHGHAHGSEAADPRSHGHGHSDGHGHGHSDGHGHGHGHGGATHDETPRTDGHAH